MDAHGGPRRFIDAFDATRAPLLATITYRWTRPADLAVFLGALRRVLAEHGRLEPLFGPTGPDLRDRLGLAIGALRAACVASAAEHGSPVDDFRELPQGVRYLLEEDEGRSVWAGAIPVCVCGEPLVADSERPSQDRLVPVEHIAYAGGFRVRCEACKAAFEVQS